MINNISQVIIGHHTTEKSTRIAGHDRLQYIFKVHKISNKKLIKKAIEEKFNVKVFGINIINMLGKMRRFGGITGKKRDWKKAYVLLEKGYAIDLEAKQAESVVQSEAKPKSKSKFKTEKS